MANFCLQCSMDHFFGPHSDFDHLKRTPLMVKHEQFFLVLCEGCGPVLIGDHGECVDLSCPHNTSRGPSEVLRRALAWRGRRSGPLRRLYRWKDYLLGTGWEPGSIHVPGTFLWRIVRLYRAIHDGEPMERPESVEWFL